MRRAVLAVAAGLVAVGTLATASAPAGAVDAPVRAGSLQEAGKGVPASLKHGQTVYLTIYYRQESRDVMVPHSFGLSLYNLRAPGQGQMRGITATWWDPVTHRWEKASHYDAEGGVELNLPLPRAQGDVRDARPYVTSASPSRTPPSPGSGTSSRA